MPLWLDLLRTPMAAPETIGLKRMRRIWQGLCLSLAASIIGLAPLTSAIGRGAPCLCAFLLIATSAVTLVYLRRKSRADDAYVESLESEA